MLKKSNNCSTWSAVQCGIDKNWWNVLSYSYGSSIRSSTSSTGVSFQLYKAFKYRNKRDGVGSYTCYSYFACVGGKYRLIISFLSLTGAQLVNSSVIEPQLLTENNFRRHFY